MQKLFLYFSCYVLLLLPQSPCYGAAAGPSEETPPTKELEAFFHQRELAKAQWEPMFAVVRAYGKDLETFFGMIVHQKTGNKFPDKPQEIIFSYLAEPTWPVAFEYVQPDGHVTMKECIDTSLQQMLTELAISQKQILRIACIKCDGKFRIIGDHQRSPLDLAFNPDHPGAWLAPSEQQVLLSLKVKNSADDKDVLKRAEQVLDNKSSFFPYDLPDPNNLLPITKLSFLEKFKQRIKPASQPLQTQQNSANSHLDNFVPIFPSAIKNLVLQYLEIDAAKKAIVFITPNGSMRYRATRPTITPWETVDHIEGEDEFKRRHLVISPASTFKIPPHFSTVRSMPEEELRTLASIQDATFLVPGPEEILLRTIAPTKLQKGKHKKVQQLKKRLGIFAKLF